MRCIRCLEDIPEEIVVCACGFPYDGVAADALPAWFAEVQRVLETSFLNAPTPWEGSGKSGTFEEWTRLRIPVSECVRWSGSFLDIGCANGFLLECLELWTAAKDVRPALFGLDVSGRLVDRARQRLPHLASRLFAGNAWDWVPPQRFDYVRMELGYVPRNVQETWVRRLLRDFVADDGRLLVCHYRSRRDDLTKGWVEGTLRGWEMTVESTASGYSATGLELTRVAVVPRPTLPSADRDS